MTLRRKFDGAFRARVALDALGGVLTAAEIQSKYKVNANQISAWKRMAVEVLPEVMGDKRQKKTQSDELLVDELHRQIGQLKVENDFLKEKSEMLQFPKRGT